MADAMPFMSNPAFKVSGFWHFADGTILPVVAGGADDGGAGDAGTGNVTGGSDGAGDSSATGTGSESVDDFDDDDDPKDLGDAGKKALAAERARAQKAERELKRQRAEIDKLRTAGQSEQEKAITKAREEAKVEALNEVRLERVRDKIEVRAAGKLADPEDAAVLLGDLTRFVDDDGSIDAKEIDRAIALLVRTKPYLAADTRRSTGDGDGGARGTSVAKPDMSSLIRRGAGLG
jgi:hypothetical protein